MAGLTGRRRQRLGSLAGALLLAMSVLAPAPAALAGPEAAQLAAPSASGAFGEALVFQTSLRSPEAPVRVELLTNLPGEETRSVSVAGLARSGPDTWTASVVQEGHVVPNTTLEYRFRAVFEDGVVVGPDASHRVVDDRFTWRSVEGERVRLSWESGDEAFARRALEVAEAAIDESASLFGVTEVRPVDFIVYSDERAFRQAMGPSTRENVGGQAHAGIRTLFGLIEPSTVDSDWVTELVTHELAHIVFADAVANPYSYPPRWLNEGLAEHLSTGATDADRALVETAARSGSIMPLEALEGQFPTRATRMSLAYAESVSAVDYLLRTYGRDGLARLIRALAAGQAFDEAMQAALGVDATTFDDAWLASVGAARPEPLGPRTAPPGPVPREWQTDAEGDGGL